MKVCLYGSGSKRTPSEFTDVGYELGLKIALNNHSLVFGGGNDAGVRLPPYLHGGLMNSMILSMIMMNVSKQILWMSEKNSFWKNLMFS